MTCVCRLNDEFFEQFADCVKDCHTMNHVGLPHNEVELRRLYCEFADTFSSILSAGTETKQETWPTNGVFGISVTRGHGEHPDGHQYTSIGFIATNSVGSTLFSKGIMEEARKSTRTGTDSGGRTESDILIPSFLYALVFIVVSFVM
ncbi:hypothetical protein KGF57_000872 [Candida theae]|uniref:Uncharacterized protein n=1 Tax=Candida theae TaxID=1198502 RepID=A0AAD5BIN8_9ASCO|nr:uncharacterized protein KGF57_000872 [Candida theae]KAI5965079.1 hypothetical protein KGF57_000872 [Candida theae]